MIQLSSGSPITTFARFAHDWFQLLARGEFAQAVAAIDEPTSYGERWSAESIQRALRDYSPEAGVTTQMLFRPIVIRVSSPFLTAAVTRSTVPFRSPESGAILQLSSSSFSVAPASQSSSKTFMCFDPSFLVTALPNRAPHLRTTGFALFPSGDSTRPWLSVSFIRLTSPASASELKRNKSPSTHLLP